MGLINPSTNVAYIKVVNTQLFLPLALSSSSSSVLLDTVALNPKQSETVQPEVQPIGFVSSGSSVMGSLARVR